MAVQYWVFFIGAMFMIAEATGDGYPKETQAGDTASVKGSSDGSGTAPVAPSVHLYQYATRYPSVYGPTANPAILHGSHRADTSVGGTTSEKGSSDGSGTAPVAPSVHLYQYATRYPSVYGPTANPAILPGSHRADTSVGGTTSEKGSSDGSGTAQVTPSVHLYQYAASYPSVSRDYVSRYYGPTAIPVVLPDGHIADTPAVAAARAAHLAALVRAKALWNPSMYSDYLYNNLYYNNQYYGYLQGGPNRPYYGPLATPTVLPSGYLADTPATAAARAAHLTALIRAKNLHGWN